MAEKQEAYQMIVRFRQGLAKAVELGYGNDECGPAVSAMFDSIVDDAFPGRHGPLSSVNLRLKWEPKRKTCSDLLSQSTRIMKLAENSVRRQDVKRGSHVVFPFLTTLAISGGLFMLAFRVAPLVMGQLLSG